MPHLNPNANVTQLSALKFRDVATVDNQGRLRGGGTVVQELQQLTSEIKKEFQSTKAKLDLGKKLFSIATTQTQENGRVSGFIRAGAMAKATQFSNQLARIEAPLKDYTKKFQAAKELQFQLSHLVATMPLVGADRYFSILFNDLKSDLKKLSDTDELCLNSYLDKFHSEVDNYSSLVSAYKTKVEVRQEALDKQWDLKPNHTE